MPRDDLSIDFVRRMPPPEVLDPALVLDEWINRVQNLPEEIRFVQEEIADKDRQYNECIKLIEERDARIQKWIKANGSHEPNPREEGYRQTIRENFSRADQFANDKIALTQRLQLIVDKHIRNLDIQIKALYDRNEPGFTDPDEIPSLLRPSAANHSAPSIRSVNPSASLASGTTALNPILNNASQSSIRASNPQIRSTISHQQGSASAPATPAASIILNRQARESSAGPGSGAPKRGPRSSVGLGNAPALSSGLARHSSLGPGTPKSHTAAGVQRAGSAGPRATTKGTGAGVGRKSGTPSSTVGRKKGTPAAGGAAGANKSGLSRVKRVSSKNSPSSAAESELSGAESISDDDSDVPTGGRGTPAARPGPSGPDKGANNNNNINNINKEGSREREGPGGSGGGGGRAGSQAQGGSQRDREGSAKGVRVGGPGAGDDEDAMDVDDDEAGDDKKYCICQNVSFGDMVACDNDACPYEWFHWSCVGLKSEPNGKWFCPVCTENMKKRGK